MTKEIDYVELLRLAHEKLGSQSDMIAELKKVRDKIDPLIMELLKCCDGLSTEFGQSNFGAANEWVRHIDNAYTKYTDAIDDHTSEKLLEAHNLEQQAKGVYDVRATTGFWNLSTCAYKVPESIFNKAKALKEQGND